MGGEYPKGGGDIPGAFAPLGGRAIFLGSVRPPGAIFLGISPPFEWGANLLVGGKSPVTTAWANSSTFLKILSCPPQNMSLPLKCPPPQF